MNPSSAPQPPAAASLQPPGTLLWIGTRRHAEMVAAYADCEARAAQIAIRSSVREAIARPAGLVRQIVIARADRSPADRHSLAELRALYGDAKAICLLGSGCEGERRTGQPWPDIERVYWHQWNQWAPLWLTAEPAAHPAAQREPVAGLAAPPRSLALVMAATLGQAAPLLDLLESCAVAAVWLRPGQRAAVRGAATVVWDDSVAPAASRRVWRQRLNGFSTGCGPAGAVRHVWVVGFPRLHHWREARRGGIDLPISKPYDADALRRLLT